MKPSFLGHAKPLLTSMIQVDNPERAISEIVNATADGADAFGLQLCRLNPKFKTEDTYRNIFSYAGDKPIYITNYRTAYNQGLTDEHLVEGILTAIKAGATLCDIMGDMFDPSPLEITKNPAVVDKQKKLIDAVHKEGGEVLMSSHTFEFLKEEQVLKIAKMHESRGADISKIVTASTTEEEMLENLKITAALKRELKIPFLFLSVGRFCKMHRMIGPMLGSCMYLCVFRHDEISTKLQPVLKNVKAVVDNFDWKPGREI